MLVLLATHLLLQAQKPNLLDTIVPSGAHPTVVATGFRFAEGPVWTPDGNLIWSDILDDTIYRLVIDKAIPFIHPSGRPIGNAFDLQGRLVTCRQQTRSITRTEKNGVVTTLASQYEGKKLNSPDDVIVRSDGTIYFTDPSFGLKPADKELPFDGVYKITPDGKLQLLLKDFVKPNGLAFSPDEKTLYVNDTVRQQIFAYDVSANGDISHERLFAYLTGELAGQPNGMKVDEKGNVYCTGPGGIHIFQPTGKFIGFIYLAPVVTNFCFGDPDRKTLYITTGQALYKIKVKIAGAVRPAPKS